MPDLTRRGLRLSLQGVVTVLVAVVLAAPFAGVWGLSRAQITDYLGPNRSTIAVDFRGETRVDLGPLGNAYVPMAYGPVGLSVDVGGIRAGEGRDALLSQQSLQAYLSLYNDPREAIAGIVQRLRHDAVRRAIPAEAVLVVVMVGWTQRRRVFPARLAGMGRGRETALAYGVVLAVTAAVVVAPIHTHPGPARYPVAAADGTRLAGLTVDSPVLDEAIDRGANGLATLVDRQKHAVNKYVDQITSQLTKHQHQLATPRAGEQRLFGFSDLHCNVAMTRIWTRLVKMTDPAVAFSTGDDTDNGTAVERSCITNEAAMVGDRPFIDSPGNHDSNTTTVDQLQSVDATVLDGTVTEVGGIRFLGDTDPEHNPPFSIDRVQERPETESEMGHRMLNTAAGRNVDVMMMHQPRATAPVVHHKNPPAKLVVWGHLHVQDGPNVIYHDDGSWTVALQMGTAGGKANPTITSFSTPFSTPRTSADVYLYFRDRSTGLITGVQPIHALPDGSLHIDDRINTGNLAALPEDTKHRLAGGHSPSPHTSTQPAPDETPQPGTTSQPGSTTSATAPPTSTPSPGS